MTGAPRRDPVLRHDVGVRIDIVAYDHPDAELLIEQLQQDYVVRWGGPDATPVDPAEFAPPHGLFMVGYADGMPVACGGWRRDGEDAELKRMYVVPARRRSGIARELLAELERAAAAAGHRRLILLTGLRQPEAIAFYRSAGYTEVARFGYYADAPEAVHLGKELPASRSPVPPSAPASPPG
jgi:GNAT superfamily N-acetyltransferase